MSAGRSRPAGRRSGRRWRAAGLTLRLAVRGIGYRRATAVVVLALAVVAATAAVVAPLYARGAEESITRGALLRADSYTVGVHADVPGISAAKAPAADVVVAGLAATLDGPMFSRPILSYSTEVRGTATTGPQAGGPVVVPLLERAGLCDHLRVSGGRCPEQAGEAAVTSRSLKLLGIAVGDRLPAGVGGSLAAVRVVGAFEPFDVQVPYWSGRPLFGYYPQARPRGLSEDPPITDTVLLGAGSAGRLAIQGYSADVDVAAGLISADRAAALADQVVELRHDWGLRSVAISGQLPDVIAGAQQQAAVVRFAAPLAAFQLVLLSWVILAHVVSAATQERAPELGLAKLRGLTPGRTVRFGLAEVVLLLLVAAPLGTALGWWLVRVAGRRLFEPGTSLQLTGWVAASVLVGVLGGVLAAAVAAYGVARGPIAELLRRVPGRGAGSRRAGLAEGVVLALTAAGVLQLLVAPDAVPGPVASAGPGMVALGAALLAGRLLRWWSGRQVLEALDRGRPAAVIGWAAVARRAGTVRTTAVLTAALVLLLVGVQAWAVAARERTVRAAVETGAAVTYQATASSPAALLAAVRAADPTGRYAMAVVRLAGTDQGTQALAVDAARADAVLAFAGRGPADVARTTHPGQVPSLVVSGGSLRAVVEVHSVQARTPVRLRATLATADGWLEVPLGTLTRGRHQLTGRVPTGCSTAHVPYDGPAGAVGCRLVGLSAEHDSTDISTAQVSLSLVSIATGVALGTPVDASFETPGAWRAPAADTAGAVTTVTAGPLLRVRLGIPGGFPARVLRGDSPALLPAVVGAANQDRAGIVVMPGLDGSPTDVRTAARVPFVPGLGRLGVLVDLDLALRAVPRATGGAGQVWLARNDVGAERALRVALEQQGVRIGGRHSAQQAAQVLSRDGAVLALLLFLACGAVAVLVSMGALLVAAFVGARQRAAEVAALRTVGVRRGVLRRALLVEHLAVVGVALVCAAAASAVAAWAVLPVLPMFDAASTALTVSAAPSLGAGLACVAAVGAVLAALAVLVASAQLRSGSVDRLREGAR